MRNQEQIETKLRLSKYRWRIACLSIVPLFIHQCGESYGIWWLCWVGLYMLAACFGACIWLSMKLVEI